MARATAVVITMPSANFGIRPIATFPEFVAGNEKMIALTAVRDAAADKLQEFAGLLHEQRKSILEFRSTLEFRLGGASRDLLPEPTLDEGDRARLQHDYDAAQKDLMEHKTVLDEIEGRCTFEIMSAVRPRHREMMARVLNAVAELSNALDEESEFRAALTAERVQAGGLPTIPFPIRSAIGTKEYTWSGVSMTMKWLETYVMPQAVG
jgi:hypothetical protein